MPPDADDPGIRQRPTSTERRSDSTSATASPAHNGIGERDADIKRRQKPQLSG
jgi:hypothetical protein